MLLLKHFIIWIPLEAILGSFEFFPTSLKTISQIGFSFDGISLVSSSMPFQNPFAMHLMNGKLLTVIFQSIRTFPCPNLQSILLSALEFHGFGNGISSAISRIKFLVWKEFSFPNGGLRGLTPLNNSRKSYRKSMLIKTHAGSLFPNYSQQLQPWKILFYIFKLN